jgi:WD40 repeat protein
MFQARQRPFLLGLGLLVVLGAGVVVWGKLLRPRPEPCIPIPEGQKYLGKHPRGALSVAFSPDGRLLASGGGEGSIKLWDTKTGEEQATLVGHTGYVEALAFSADGNMLASGGGFGDGSVRFWDVPTATLRTVLHLAKPRGIEVSAKFLALSADNQTLAVGVRKKDAAHPLDGEVVVWDIRTAQQIRTFTDFNHFHVMVALTPDHQTLIVPDKKGVRLRVLELATGQERAVLKPAGTVTLFGFGMATDGKTLCALSARGSPADREFSNLATLWDLTTYQPVAAVPLQQIAGYMLTFAPDARSLAKGAKWGVIHLWDMPQGTKRAEISVMGNEVYGTCIAPDNKSIAYACESGQVMLAKID